MLDGESFQKVEATRKDELAPFLFSSLLTEVFLALLALIDHAEEQVTFAAKDGIDADFELDVAVEYVQGSLAENDTVLRAIFAQDFAELVQGQSFSTPLLIKGLVYVVELSDVNASVD